MDDSRTTITLEKNILKTANYNVVTANNGAEALTKLENIDIIITDIEMPVMNGIELIENIRIKNKVIPIIVITSRHDTDTIKKCFDVGATDLIEKKDFSKNMFISKIKQYL